jgi:hypothetical protein
LFVDEALVRRKIKFGSEERSRWKKIRFVEIPEVPVKKEEYILDSREFKVVKVVGRVYKPSARRRRVYEDNGLGIGIGGYIIRYADGHEFCVPPPVLKFPFFQVRELMEDPNSRVGSFY